MSDLILMGYVARAFGLRGGVSLKLWNADSQTFFVGQRISLRQLRSDERILTISSILDGGRFFFEGIADRNAALALCGAQIFVDRADLKEPADDEYYLHDLLLAHVLDQDGKPLGEIVGFSSNGAQTLFEVKTPAGDVISIPGVSPIVMEIDVAQKRVMIDPPEGLFDLAGRD